MNTSRSLAIPGNSQDKDLKTKKNNEASVPMQKVVSNKLYYCCSKYSLVTHCHEILIYGAKPSNQTMQIRNDT